MSHPNGGGIVNRILILAAALVLPCTTASAGPTSEVGDRVVSSAIVLKEIAGIPEQGIPHDLLDKASCIAVVPSMIKAGFIAAGNYGKGVISCRLKGGAGPWSPPSMIMVGGGSFGLQLGVQSTDLILVIMNLSGLESLLNSKFTLGGDASVAAGPVGRTATAETDAFLSARILAYSRSRGLFAGISLKGGVVRPDMDAIQVLYGKAIEPRTILFEGVQNIPKDAQIFVDEINRLSPKKK
jgi:lipid-binding SYLF domain-containing protein